ncbi:hypothetical protein [Herbaspirillum frisingense]|uniref:hypothetical protein n=1 Tax=Herbaspirillum frisingense TaxID=92645 RepID=UPI001F2714BF|nr:hypothetical protein [Herbaspirillum frisingense]UIN19603.1 hypothetical protein LAZ82_13950 [Herbaspirillum frisingense]
MLASSSRSSCVTICSDRKCESLLRKLAASLVSERQQVIDMFALRQIRGVIMPPACRLVSQARGCGSIGAPLKQAPLAWQMMVSRAAEALQSG